MLKTITKAKKLSIRAETLRTLRDSELAAVAGGYTTYIYCQPTDATCACESQRPACRPQ